MTINKEWFISEERYDLKDAARISHELLGDGLRVRFDDLASGLTSDGDKVITCRINVLKTPDFILSHEGIKSLINSINK